MHNKPHSQIANTTPATRLVIYSLDEVLIYRISSYAPLNDVADPSLEALESRPKAVKVFQK